MIAPLFTKNVAGMRDYNIRSGPVCETYRTRDKIHGGNPLEAPDDSGCDNNSALNAYSGIVVDYPI